MNLQQYAHELRQEYNLPNQCQFCGEYVDKIDLCHIMPRSKANAKILMKKLGITQTQAYALLDCYGLNTIFGCAKCNGYSIGGGKTCKTDDITIWNETYWQIHLKCMNKMYKETGDTDWFIEHFNLSIRLSHTKDIQYNFQKIFYQGV